VLSVLYAVSYLALGTPAVIGGFLAVHDGVLAAGREYGLAVIVLAALALVRLVAQPSQPAARASAPVSSPQATPLATRV
jgi:hypothetical protein